MDPYQDSGLIQRLRNAVEALEREEPIQQRLRFAYENYLSDLMPEDFPDHRKEDFEALEEACTWIPAEDN